eukprot:TRINITY_DN2640_c0_g1_i14.p1 TRINITY_DN2640_c0_g1~~TRINITY_DN2640_c0_g1_i14.p1  ORF type:complete len:275 (-),score=30.00 TRINITY_DN2640_c0_g1_i14:144-968(-)
MQLIFSLVLLFFGLISSDLISCDCSDSSTLTLSWDLRTLPQNSRYWFSLWSTSPLSIKDCPNTSGCSSNAVLDTRCPVYSQNLINQYGVNTYGGVHGIRYCTLWSSYENDCSLNRSKLILQNSCTDFASRSVAPTNNLGFIGLVVAVLLLFLIFALLRRRLIRQTQLSHHNSGVQEGEEMWGIPGTANSAPTVLPTTTTTTTTTTPVVATTTPNSFPSYVVVTNPYPNNNPPVQLFPAHPMMQTNEFPGSYVSTNLSPIYTNTNAHVQNLYYPK